MISDYHRDIAITGTLFLVAGICFGIAIGRATEDEFEQSDYNNVMYLMNKDAERVDEINTRLETVEWLVENMREKGAVR